jgi:hypothetical protein
MRIAFLASLKLTAGLMPALNESRERHKGFAIEKRHNRRANDAALLNCSGTGWDSIRREPAQRGVRDYAFNDPSKNRSEFTWPKSSRAEAVVPISNYRQPPTTFLNGHSVKHTYVRTCQQRHHFR